MGDKLWWSQEHHFQIRGNCGASSGLSYHRYPEEACAEAGWMSVYRPASWGGPAPNTLERMPRPQRRTGRKQEWALGQDGRSPGPQA